MADEGGENLKHGLQLLQKCSKQDAEKVTHELLDCICSGKNLRYQSYGKLWTIQEWKVLQENGKEELKGFITRGLNREQISNELDRYSLSEEVKQAVLDCLWPRQEEVRQSLVQNTTMISNAVLKDFDWKVKMTMSSDKLATIRQPTVTVNFDVDESGQERHTSVELTNDELKHLISSLEAANKVVMQLKK